MTLASIAALDPDTRWMIADFGRSTLYIALVLTGLPGGLTVAGLKAAANRVCSAGRVTAFIDHCLRTGRLTLSPGSEPWTRRRLAPTAAFIQPRGRVLAAQMCALSPLATNWRRRPHGCRATRRSPWRRRRR